MAARVVVTGVCKVSEERKSGFGDGGGGGPKKPKATFGDVMQGIPAGRGGEREDRGRGRKGGGSDRGEQKADASAPNEGRLGGRDARRGGGERKPAEEKPRSSGPMVVVKR